MCWYGVFRLPQEARQQRKAADDRATQAREWRQKALEGNVASKQQQQQQAKAGGKRKAGDGQGEEAGAKAGGKQQGQGQKQGKQQQEQGQGPANKKARKEGGAAGEEGADLKFARIEVEGGEARRGRERKWGQRRRRDEARQRTASSRRTSATAGLQESRTAHFKPKFAELQGCVLRACSPRRYALGTGEAWQLEHFDGGQHV